jgi:S-formylglutathione hydrolase FrmB
MKKNLCFIILCFLCLHAFAARVDTVSIYSKAMNKEFKCVVIVPTGNSNNASTRWPVVYLLHGYSGSYNNWVNRVPALKKYSDQYGIIVVCPDGGYSSWYLDSPIDPGMRYETYIAVEVPEYIDKHFPTILDRHARAITGLSMGGHGGLFLGFRHANYFGACGSMSGGVNLYATRNKYDLMKRVGDTANNGSNWKKYSVMSVVEEYPKDSLAIIFDCGTEDFFYQDNHSLHEKLVRLKVPHEYIERPGKHDWKYWGNAVQYQLLFFSNYFNAIKQ